MSTFWLFDFFKESYGELKKATWLSRKEVAQSTLVVVFLVCLVALYVGSVDFVLSIILRPFLAGR